MSHTHVAPHLVPSEPARRAPRRRAANWRLVALAAFFLMLVAAELAIVITVAPTADPLAVVAVP